MSDLYSNSPAGDLVLRPFQTLLRIAQRAQLAAPYFTAAADIRAAAQRGCRIELLIGLNPVTSPDALASLMGIPNLALRYLTHRFHAKIFLFDEDALVGSSNLTDGGLFQNREATLRLFSGRDTERIDDTKALFADLWESAETLTPDTLQAFRRALAVTRAFPDPDVEINRAVRRAEPRSVRVESQRPSARRLYEATLRREVYEEYRPAFHEVMALLQEHELRREGLGHLSLANETNRFLNWLRLTYVRGKEWQQAAERAPDARRQLILQHGRGWRDAKDHRIPPDYVAWLQRVAGTFGTWADLQAATQETLSQGLVSLHAFAEQLRFVEGGLAHLPAAFWHANGNQVERVRASLNHLLHGPGDFVARLHDLLYSPRHKIALFGRFCALELFGTVKPEECPPINGRMAKALRHLGFSVRAA